MKVATKKNYGAVLITGASSGIGYELALEFGGTAETLVLTARRVDRLEKLRADLLAHYPNLKVVVLAADVSDEREVETLIGESVSRGLPSMCW
jgi:short-subunit dehydrogenase